MGLLDRLFGTGARSGSTGAAEYRWTLADPPEWLTASLSTWAGENVTVKGALSLVPVFSCVSLLATEIGSVPMIVYRGEGRERERDRGSPAWKLLHDRPNVEQPADLFFETMVGHLNMWGNFFAEKEKGSSGMRTAGVVGNLWPIVPSRVRVDREKGGAQRKVFEIDGEPKAYYADRILHVPAFGYDGLVGLSPIGVARQTIGTAIARDRWEGDFYGNGASPGGYLQHPGKLSPGAKADLRAQWEAMHRGSGNRHRAAVLEEGLTWQSAGMPLRDMQFVENASYSTNQIARIFHVPPEMIGGTREGGLTYSTVEGQALHFVKFSLRRWLTRIERALHADPDLFPDKDRRPEFLVEGLLRGDSSGRAAFYKTMKELGAMSVEEIRERENLGPKIEGDTFQESMPGAPAPVVNEEDEDA